MALGQPIEKAVLKQNVCTTAVVKSFLIISKTGS